MACVCVAMMPIKAERSHFTNSLTGAGDGDIVCIKSNEKSLKKTR